MLNFSHHLSCGPTRVSHISELRSGQFSHTGTTDESVVFGGVRIRVAAHVAPTSSASECQSDVKHRDRHLTIGHVRGDPPSEVELDHHTRHPAKDTSTR
jgi:hypothetical protein